MVTENTDHPVEPTNPDGSERVLQRAVTMRFMAAPTDVLMQGSHGVYGGRVLEWIDKAAYACAVGWSGTNCVTAYIGHIHFTRPIPSGHVVEINARIVYTGRTSMHIVTEVLSADPRELVFTRACDCLVIFVALGENQRPTPVPHYEPVSKEEKRLAAAAASRVELRKAIATEMLRQTYTDDSTGPRMTFRFMARPTDVNWSGNLHGGTAMVWIDEAATACTMGWAGNRTMATYAGGIRFYRPVHIGDLIEVDARIIRTDERSMHVSVHLRNGDPRNGEESLQVAMHASMAYIGLDIDGNPLNARPFTPVTEEDKRLEEHAQILRKLRETFQPLPLFLPLRNESEHPLT